MSRTPARRSHYESCGKWLNSTTSSRSVRQRTTRAGIRGFVLITPSVVAVLAVATDTPSVMLLFSLPGAVVIYVLHVEYGGVIAAAPSVPPPSRMDHRSNRNGTHLVRIPFPEATRTGDSAVGRYQAHLLRRALGHLDITPHRLWRQYLSHGGCIGELEINAYLHDSLYLPAGERDLLVQATNALLDQQSHPPVPIIRALSYPSWSKDFPENRHRRPTHAPGTGGPCLR